MLVWAGFKTETNLGVQGHLPSDHSQEQSEMTPLAQTTDQANIFCLCLSIEWGGYINEPGEIQNSCMEVCISAMS